MSKTYTGGYRLVSLAFADLALASTAIAVAGLGDALGVKSRKRIVLTDIVVGGEKKNDVTVQVKKDGNNYVIEDVYGYDLEIVTNGSTLTATPHANPAGGTKLYLHTVTGLLFGSGAAGVTYRFVTNFANELDEVLTSGGPARVTVVGTLPENPVLINASSDVTLYGGVFSGAIVLTHLNIAGGSVTTESLIASPNLADSVTEL